MALEYVTEENFKNDAGKYIDMLSDENINVIITRDGEEVGRLIPKSEVIRFISDEARGILKDYETSYWYKYIIGCFAGQRKIF